MPFCPQCRHEFESRVADCPDCDVALCAELAPTPQAGEPEFRLALILAADERVVEILEENCRLVGTPVSRLEPDRIESQASECGLYLPQEMFRQVVGILDGDARLLRGSAVVQLTDDQGKQHEEALICYQKFDQVKSSDREIRAPELLDRPLPELIARGGELVGELLELIRRGDDATRKKAILAVSGMGSEGREALARMLGVLAREGRESALFAVLKAIEARLADPAQLADLIAVAQDCELEPSHRALALHALGRSGMKGVYQPILELLDDPDPMIREEADETLCTLADEDLGFDPELPKERRAAIAEQWRVLFLDQCQSE